MYPCYDSKSLMLGMDAPSDDLDVVVKHLFSDLEFKKKNNLCSINSINWARIMLQTVRHFHLNS